MSLGVQVSVADTPAGQESLVETGTGFAVGLSERGLQEPTLITSLERFKDAFGERQSDSVLYDAVETFFNEGGSRLYVSRAVGPTPVKATCNIFDQAGSVNPGDITLVATAVEYGTWANGLNVEIDDNASDGTITAGSFVVTVTHDDDGALEVSDELLTRAAAVTWSADSDYIRLALGASNEDPRAQGPTSLAGGTGDHSNITATEWNTAIDAFEEGELGPGQVFAPGVTLLAVQSNLIEHAAANNRRALIDFANTSTVATITAAVEALTGDDDLEDSLRYAAGWANWITIRGLTPTTSRTVPSSCVIAGLIARSDRQFSANKPAAGKNGISVTAVDVAVAFDKDTINTLADAGVNAFKTIAGNSRGYGFRSLAPKVSQPAWWQFNNSRLIMAIAAKLGVIGEDYMFEEIDGGRRKLAEFQGELVGELIPLYDGGSLFGATPEEAFRVDAKSVEANPDSELALGNVRALVWVKPSPFAESIQIVLVKAGISDPVPA